MTKLPAQQVPNPTSDGDILSKGFADAAYLGPIVAAKGDYLLANSSTSPAIPANDTPFTSFDTPIDVRGGLSLSSGRVSFLRAGRTYLLQGKVRTNVVTAEFLTAQWYDVTGDAYLGVIALHQDADRAVNSSESEGAWAIFTPLVDSEVEFHPRSGGGTGSISGSSSAIMIMELGAVLAESIGGLEFMDIIEVTSPQTQVAFGELGDGLYKRPLDGDVDEQYEMSYLMPNHAGSGILSLRPNNETTNIISARGGEGNSSVGSEGTVWQMCQSAAGFKNAGHCWIQAKSGNVRTYRGVEVQSNLTDQTWTLENAGFWTDIVDNITSLVVNSADAGGIVAGARFILWRRTSKAIRTDNANTYERRVESAVDAGSATTEQTTGHTNFSGSVIGLSARIEKAVTAGTVTCNLKVDGVTTLSVELNTDYPTSRRQVVPIGAFKVGADKNVSVEIVAASYDNATSETAGITVVATLVNEGLAQAPVTETAYPPGWLDGLEMSFNTVSTVDIAAGSCRDSTDTENIVVGSPLTANIAVVGANGRDAGSETADTWYALYVIADSTGQNSPASLLSTSFSSPTLPSGYDIFRRVGAVRNNSSSAIENFRITGNGRVRRVWWDNQFLEHQVLSLGGSGTLAVVDCSGSMPPTSRLGLFYSSYDNGGAGNSWDIRPNGGGDDHAAIRPGLVTTSTFVVGPIECPTDASQQIQYQAASSTLDLYVTAWDDEL
jgi:hypothetical protein